MQLHPLFFALTLSALPSAARALHPRNVGDRLPWQGNYAFYSIKGDGNWVCDSNSPPARFAGNKLQLHCTVGAAKTVDFYLYNDKDTYTVKNIPQNNKGGLFVAGDGAQLGDCTIDSDYQISCNGLTNRK